MGGPRHFDHFPRLATRNRARHSVPETRALSQLTPNMNSIAGDVPDPPIQRIFHNRAITGADRILPDSPIHTEGKWRYPEENGELRNLDASILVSRWTLNDDRFMGVKHRHESQRHTVAINLTSTNLTF